MSKVQKHNAEWKKLQKDKDLCLYKTNIKQTFSYIVYGYKWSAM